MRYLIGHTEISAKDLAILAGGQSIGQGAKPFASKEAKFFLGLIQEARRICASLKYVESPALHDKAFYVELEVLGISIVE